MQNGNWVEKASDIKTKTVKKIAENEEKKMIQDGAKRGRMLRGKDRLRKKEISKKKRWRKYVRGSFEQDEIRISEDARSFKLCKF